MKGIIKKIDQIHFSLMSPEQIREMSVVKIERPDTYDEDGYPIESGLMDSRLGVIDPSLKCRTCGEKGGECQGHFGMIDLARPVIHVDFGDDIHKILRSTCSECGRVLLNEEEIEEYTKKMETLHEMGESVEVLVKEVYKICKDRKTKEVCPHCSAEQEDIKIVKPIDIIEVRRQYDEFGELITDENGNPRTEDYDLTASEVREKLQKIPDEDAYVLGVNPKVARPEWMVLTVLPVPPVTMRPSITLDTGERSEDDLTHKLVDILRINQRLIENMDAGAPQLIVEDLWKLLQYHVTTYFDNEASGVPPARHRSGRPLKTLAQRLKGKEGRFRSNLSGKRVNFSARTVISPDPNISINEVGVPYMIAKEVTVPTYVNEWNIDDLRETVMRGPNVHPGANYVKKIINNMEMKVRVLDANKDVVAENLQYGDIVMRHLRNRDIVLFNRQPSLHRMTMMAHEVRVLPYKTFRINPAVCPPYNADFDGDEMNMHVFQTDESRAEAKSLMRVQEHILSPRFGGPIIGAIHDHISGAYLLTRDGFTVPEDDAFQMIRKAHLLNNPYVDKKHLERKNRDWTGKELFSLLLPDDLNMNYKAEICRECEICQKEDCQYDAFVVIKDGQLTNGAIDEAAFGSFSGKILGTIAKEYGPSRAKEFLDRSTEMAIDAITRIGMTTSLNDEEIPEEALEVIEAHLDMANEKVDKLIETYIKGDFPTEYGRSAEESLEMRIVQVLGEARDKAGEIAERYLNMGKESPDDSYDNVMAVENHSVVMARTGARASMLNLAQITACLGQQSVRGERITRGYKDRTLPHFRKHDLGARAKGFVYSSYNEGLGPVEFFFHAIGGRDGLVDTAIRTAQSGYMQRRLVNALLDLNVRSDGLVTDNKGQVIQRVFGEEGIDPAKSDFGHVANIDNLIDVMRIKNDDFYQDNGDDHSSSEDKPNVQNPVKSKEDNPLESLTKRYIKSYGRTKDMINSLISDYDSLHDDYLELNSHLEKLDIKINQKLALEINPFAKEINAIDLNLNEVDSLLSEAQINIQKYKDKLASLKGESYKFSSFDEVDAEISKLNSISHNLQLAEIDRIEMKLDEEISSFDSIKEKCDSLIYIQNKKNELIKKINSKINKINFELSENSNLSNVMNNLLIDINGLDKDFTENNSEKIGDLLGEMSNIAQNSIWNIDSANDLKGKLKKSINSLERVKDREDLNEKRKFINALLNKDMPVDILKIRQDYEEQMIIYDDLKIQELEFKEKRSKEENFKENYSELYEMGLNYNDVNEEILHIYSKFIEYKSGIVHKFKITSSDLSEKDVNIINSNIIFDIVNHKITETNFNLIYEEYIEKYQDSENYFISDDEFKEKYKELSELGFTSKDIDEEILENCSKFNDYVMSPIFKLKSFEHSLNDDAIDIINKRIVVDIVNKALAGDLNFDSIYKIYSDRYKAEKRLEGINWDEILKNIDLRLYNDEIIEFCKEKITAELKDGKISQNQVKSRFKVYISKKKEIDKKLVYLEMLKNKPDSPENKQYLTQKELENIYLLVESEISKENPDSAYDILKNNINIRIKRNQSKARKEFEKYYKDSDKFFEITRLVSTQSNILISRIEYFINNNRIKAEDINEDFLREEAIKLKNDIDYVESNY